MFERKNPSATPRPATPVPAPEKPPLPAAKAPLPPSASDLATPNDQGSGPRAVLPPVPFRATQESTSAKPAPEARQHGDRTLIVGRGIAFSAEISACDNLVVEGTVEARLPNAERVEITESGLFRGTAGTRDGDIGGRFEGELKVSGRLIVRSTGRVEGKIQYGELAVEAGGRIEGELRNINSKSDAKTEGSTDNTKKSVES